MDSDERPDVCVESAPKVAVANCIILLLAVVVFVVAYCCYGQNGVANEQGDKYICSLRVWSIVYFVILIIIFMFMLSTLYV